MKSRLIAILVCFAFVASSLRAQAYIHGRFIASSLGMNLNGVQPATLENPFLNVMKIAGGWYTENGSSSDTAEEVALYSTFVDGNHYPTSLTTGGPCPGGPCPSHTFTQVSFYTLISSGIAAEQTGTYVLLYTGVSNTATAGTITVGRDASITSCPTAGRCLLAVPTASNGIKVTITATDPNATGNYINNIAVIYSPDSTSSVVGVNETAFVNGGCMTAASVSCTFNPPFITAIRYFKNALRMMDWGATLHNKNINWADRSLPSWAFWDENNINDTTTNNNNGVPVEVMVALANAIGADLWVNLPCNSTDSYVQSEASLINSSLNAGLKVYPEYCNEVWNNAALNSTVFNNMVSAGQTAYPNAQTSVGCPGGPFSSFSYAFAYGILRAVQNSATFVSVMGSSRVHRLAGGQAFNTGRNDYILSWLAANCGGDGSLFTGAASANVDFLATAPYIANGTQDPLAWTADGDGGLGKFFTEQDAGGILPQSVTITGNCGNGAGKTCDAGGNTAFTLTTGLSLPDPPTNGTCVGMTFNVANGSAATLAADGGTAYPLADAHGNALGSGSIQPSNVVLCFTNATSAGAVTAKWRQNIFGKSGGWLKQATDVWAANAVTAASHSVGLIAYESGQQYVPGNDAAYETWFFAAMRDARMGTDYTSYYTTMRASSPNVLTVFNDITNFSQFGMWGALETVLQPNTPRYNAVRNFVN